MNQARFQSIFNNLTVIAQKVFSAVPIADTWNAVEVHQELVRQGRARDFKTTQGCLASLVESGIVVEPERGAFRRAKMRVKAMDDLKEIVPSPPTPASMPLKEQPIMPTVPHSPDAGAAKLHTPLDRLSLLSGRVQQMMAGLQALADDIETAALEIADQMAENEENARKLKQLQALLKSLG